MKKIIGLLFVVGLSLGLESVTFAKCGTRTPRVSQRQHRQDRRIHQGVRSGELTRREFVRLEREQYDIQQEKREAKSDGTVTRRERAELQRELNQASRHIYRAKHNERDRN
jgi:hypothetical protein